MTDEGLTRKTACELASLINSRAVSPVDVLDAHLAVIERVNPKLNAIVTLAAEQARTAAHAAAKAVMRGDTLGTLHGLPIGIKDVTLTAGIRTTFGSPLFRDNVPTEDAEVVRRLKAAGAIVLAKTNTPEFATGANTVNELFGATRNPWNSALARRLFGRVRSRGRDRHAADRAGHRLRLLDPHSGSVLRHRRDTADTGLTPNYPMPLAWDPGQVHGPLARTAEDAALMLDSMVGFSRLSPISAAPSWGSARAKVADGSIRRGCGSPMGPTLRVSVSTLRSTRSAGRRREGCGTPA